MANNGLDKDARKKRPRTCQPGRSRIAVRFGNGPAELSGLKWFPRALIRAREQSARADGPSAHSSAGPLGRPDGKIGKSFIHPWRWSENFHFAQ
jgi:hypothetical protein